MQLEHYIYSRFRRHVMCRLGLHGPKAGPDGSAANFCGWGCGHAFNPNAYSAWLVTVQIASRTEIIEVQAVNAFHASNVVVYGDGKARIDGATGKPLNAVRCHRENIISVQPKAIS